MASRLLSLDIEHDFGTEDRPAEDEGGMYVDDAGGATNGARRFGASMIFYLSTQC
jgi:hypothetical protein